MTTAALIPNPASRRARRAILAAAAAVALAVLLSPARAESNSARYRFEGNKWLSLDLAVGDVRLEVIKFEWPATMMRIKTGYKATARLVNGSSRQIKAGIAVVLYDPDGKLVGAGTTGTTLGTVDPGDAANFSIEFDHVTERLEQATQFHIALETR